MTNVVVAALGCWLSLMCYINAETQEALEYPFNFKFDGNPLVKHASAADPHAIVYDDTLWIYTSTDANQIMEVTDEYRPHWKYDFMDGYRAYSTTDLVNWTDHGEIFHSRNVPWSEGSGWMWAPAGVRKDGVYYLYYPHKNDEGRWCVGVATAAQPQGPFTDVGTPIAGANKIDPMVFIDDDGEAYLYLNPAMVGKLKPNMIELAEPMRYITYGPPEVMESHEKSFEEGSFMHKKDGVYYYSYSNGRNKETKAYYATGDNPYGPFEWQGPLAGETLGAPDHHSVVLFKGEWVYFSHYGMPRDEKDLINWAGYHRAITMDKLSYNSDGTIQLVEHTHGSRTNVKINAGGTWHPQADGSCYVTDTFYTRGKVRSTTESISGDDDERLFQTQRVGYAFEYDIPLENGLYNITFSFAELETERVEERSFDVIVEGNTVISNLNIWSKVGTNAAYTETHQVKLRGGELNIAFESIIMAAVVSAISVEKVSTTASQAFGSTLTDPNEVFIYNEMDFDQEEPLLPTNVKTPVTKSETQEVVQVTNRLSTLVIFCVTATMTIILYRRRTNRVTHAYRPVNSEVGS